jgi:GT2 family glycosyltransferase
MLSIVIPSHARNDLLRCCLDSVQAYGPRGVEVLVVDDGSAGAAVTRTAEQRARVLRLPRRRGFCVAANVGIRAARYEIVQLLNDDTEVRAGWAEAALKHFADSSVAAVAPLVLSWPDGACVDSAGDAYALGGVARKRHHGRRVGDVTLAPGEVFGASASSAFYRRSAVLEVGAFPEEFGAYFEDVDLAFRLRRAGFRAVFEPASRVLHHGSSSHGRSSRKLIEQQSCNEERVFWRNLPARALPRALPRHLAILLAKAWRRTEEGTLLPFLCGRLRVATEWRRVLRHRARLRSLGADADVARWHVEADRPVWALAGGL